MVTQQTRTLIVKLDGATPPAEGSDLLREILGRFKGATVEPLFPGDEDDEIGRLFNVTLRSSISPRKAIVALEKNPHVQYAHEPKGRSPA